MTNLAKHLQQNIARRPYVVQVRLSEEDKARLDALADKYGVRPTRLMYEIFRYSIDLYDEHESSKA